MGLSVLATTRPAIAHTRPAGAPQLTGSIAAPSPPTASICARPFDDHYRTPCASAYAHIPSRTTHTCPDARPTSASLQSRTSTHRAGVQTRVLRDHPHQLSSLAHVHDPSAGTHTLLPRPPPQSPPALLSQCTHAARMRYDEQDRRMLTCVFLSGRGRKG